MSDDWKVYRTRFLVCAKQLTESLTFTDPLGREQHGNPGDYLVRSSEGWLRLAQREIFEDVYVMMDGGGQEKSSFCSPAPGHLPPSPGVNLQMLRAFVENLVG